MQETHKVTFRGAKMLLRLTALILSGVAAALSTYLPLMFYYDVRFLDMFHIFVVLAVGIVLIQGILTHAYNDIADYHSGTDQRSPAMLSGGSRVLIEDEISMKTLNWIAVIGTIVAILVLIIAILLGATRSAILIGIGLFAAFAYSLPPFRFGYRPFLSEIFCLFPAIFFLTIAAPWLAFGEIPYWAWQNGLINAFWFMAWVMISAIQDLDADRQAKPLKRTTTMYFEERMGRMGSPTPAMIYLLVVGLITVWVLFTRPIAAVGLIILLGYNFYLILKMNPKDNIDVKNKLAHILYSAGIAAIWLGFFV